MRDIPGTRCSSVWTSLEQLPYIIFESTQSFSRSKKLRHIFMSLIFAQFFPFEGVEGRGSFGFPLVSREVPVKCQVSALNAAAQPRMMNWSASCLMSHVSCLMPHVSYSASVALPAPIRSTSTGAGTRDPGPGTVRRGGVKRGCASLGQPRCRAEPSAQGPKGPRAQGLKGPRAERAVPYCTARRGPVRYGRYRP